MIPLANRPILSYVVDALVSSGITEIIMVVGYKKERIMNYFGDGLRFKTKISYVTQEKQLGTGHALLQAIDHFDDETLVIPADNIIDEEMILEILSKPANTLLCIQHDEPSKYGVVHSENNQLKKLYEKPKTQKGNIISTGIYKFSQDILPTLQDTILQGKTELTDTLKALLANNKKIHTFIGEGYWKDLVYPWDIITANETLVQRDTQSHLQGYIDEGVTMKGPVSIGKDTVVHAGTHLLGPLEIGEGCEIGPYACIFPSTSIGDNVTIGTFSEIKNSVIMNNTFIDSRCSVKQSVIGEGCTLESQVLTLIGPATDLYCSKNKIMNQERVGAFIGENSYLQAGTVLHPGVIVGCHTHVNPLKNIATHVKEHSLVV